MLTPFLRNLRAACPNSIIDVLLAPDSAELLAHCPYINHRILIDRIDREKRSAENNPPAASTALASMALGSMASAPQTLVPESSDSQALPEHSFWEALKVLKANNYDWAFVLKRSFSSALLAFLAGIPHRVGFNTEYRRLLLTKPVAYYGNGHANTRHERDAFLSVLEAVGISVKDKHLEFWVRPENTQKALQTLASGITGKSLTRIVVHLTSSNPAKQWPEEHALNLLERLLSFHHVVVHCLGAASDTEGYSRLGSKLSMAAQNRFYNHCGTFSLNDSMAFLQQMDLVIGVDSGPLHMAAAVGVKTIALFGPMNPVQWAPVEAVVLQTKETLDCQPCNLKVPCHREYACMQSLLPDEIMAEVKQHFK